MLLIKADLAYKNSDIRTMDCVIEKVIRLSHAEFDAFSRDLRRDWPFLRDNRLEPSLDKEGRYRSLLVLGDGRRDGIIVNTEGMNYARYSKYIPNAEELLTVGRYPALAALNKKLVAVADSIIEEIREGAYADSTDRLRYTVDLNDLENMFDVEIMGNGMLINTLLDIIGQNPEIADCELDNDEIILYVESVRSDELTDPTVTRTDMYAYGYGWDGMIPLGKERALELFVDGHGIFRLYEDGSEDAADSLADVETFKGLFGVKDPKWVEPEREQAPFIQVFVLNREKHDNGESVGEWLSLPADADDLLDLFERVGVDRPSEGAFAVTAVRAPDCVRDRISKYDSIDELNMLASRIETVADFDRLEKLRATLTGGVTDTGRGVADLIDLIENMDCFESVDGVTPEEYRITGAALQALRLGVPGRAAEDEKRRSVMGRIREARKAPRGPHGNPPEKSKRKGGPEL
jgi:hypothetical protein